MKSIKIIAVLILLTLIASCRQAEKANQEEAEHNHNEAENSVSITKRQFDAVGIQLGKIEKRNLSSSVKASGRLMLPPQNRADVNAIYGGIVKKIFVVEGNFVNKGQRLISLESKELLETQQDYLEVAAEIPYLEEEYLRQKDLQLDNINSKKSFQQAESNYKIAEARRTSLEEKLKLFRINANELETPASVYSITAPISGYVHQINISTGSYVEPEKVMMDIVDNRFLHLDLTVFEKDIFKIKNGQKVFFNYANTDVKNKINIATIYGIDKAFIENQQAIIVHAKLNESNPDLLPGMYVNADIQVDNFETDAVPDDAIVSEGDLHYIFVEDHSGHSEHEHKEGEHKEEEHKEGEHKEGDHKEEDHKDGEHAEGEHEHSENEGNNPDDKLTFKRYQITKGVSDNGYTEIKPLEEIPSDAEIVISGSFSLLSEMTKDEGHHEH